ncbi:UbiA prenyltransferase family protein [Planktothrix mougeotii]|uniref:UbiA prenyltransferase family protein n=1 Tax=Planktothrix mougeotii LEGE 06226 TaxID=1828728 RepID=A0ABR9U7K4_9CYAN|nr:UbiA prenyltransferase family protein [Planktothrix mougeotii]MBE9142412.1 UbiA prenyltransferase family protein [Planktothrix mougeotii LEGE 06226]
MKPANQDHYSGDSTSVLETISETTDPLFKPTPSKTIPPLIKLLRPHQWTKNLFCLAGLLFGGRLLQPQSIWLSGLTVIFFSAMASAIYIFNDIQDRERDRLHPKKKYRPLASGQVSVKMGFVIAIPLAIISLWGAYFLGVPTLICILLYAINNIAYSLKLKNIPLFDVNCIAFGFVLRLLAGIYALGDMPTAWIVLCTFFLTLFLGFSKRRSELLSLLHFQNHQDSLESENLPQEDIKSAPLERSYLHLFYQRGRKNQQRPVLSQYTLPYLDSLLNSTATMTIMCYALFTITSGKNPSLVITVPIVYYAVMHYKWLVTVLAEGEEPSRILIQDTTIKLSLMIWLICYLAILYFKINLFH